MNKSAEYIYQIYKEGGFSRAARKLYVSQPALSAIVRRTEAQLHTTLFDRSKKPIQLTEAGMFYIDCIERIRAIEYELHQYFDGLHSGTNGSLSIGSGTYYCTYLLPDIIHDFNTLNPGIKMTLSESNSKQTLNMLLNGQLNFILDVNENTDPALESVAIAKENMVLAVPVAFPCNEKLRYCRLTFEDIRRGIHLGDKVPPVDMSALRDEPFILTKPGNHSHDLVWTLCRQSGFEPRSVLDMDQLLTTYYVACEGTGITVVRDISLCHVAYTSALCFYRLPLESSKRNIYLTCLKKNFDMPTMRLFVDYALTQSERFYLRPEL